MDIFSSVILGIVEGLTEFLPVSSTGHLILTSKLLNIQGDVQEVFEVFIQLGAILAIVVLYRNKWLEYFFNREEGTFKINNRSLLVTTVAIVPFLIFGVLFHSKIKQLFDLKIVAIGFLIGGILLVLIDFFKNKFPAKINSLEELAIRNASFVGIFQCLALIPGMSRSASTIIGGIVSGVDKRTAAEFSFLIAVPIMILAVGGDLYKSYHLLSMQDILPFAIGFIVSFTVAMYTVQFFIKIISKLPLSIFGWYRIIVGIMILKFFS